MVILDFLGTHSFCQAGIKMLTDEYFEYFLKFLFGAALKSPANLQ